MLIAVLSTVYDYVGWRWIFKMLKSKKGSKGFLCLSADHWTCLWFDISFNQRSQKIVWSGEMGDYKDVTRTLAIIAVWWPQSEWILADGSELNYLYSVHLTRKETSVTVHCVAIHWKYEWMHVPRIHSYFWCIFKDTNFNLCSDCFSRASQEKFVWWVSAGVFSWQFTAWAGEQVAR